MSELSSEEWTFEQSLAELDRIVRDLEDGKLGLEEALGHYESGVGLLKRCYTRLREAEQKILLLTGTDADGQPVTRPFEHAATADGSPAETKRRRKKPDGPEIPF